MTIACLFAFSGYAALRRPHRWEFAGLLANGVSLVAAPLFTTIALLLRIRMEERVMAEHFGQAYEDYRRATWRLLPLIW
jgi:protein-S-isoprenylcysteine O-methyltransferase Ste14